MVDSYKNRREMYTANNSVYAWREQKNKDVEK